MMANWTGPAAKCGWSLQWAIWSKGCGAMARAWQNEAVMSPEMRQRLRLVGVIGLGWTVAGLFYIIQDAVPRLYRGGAVPWKYVFVGWMAGMYVCAALTPAVLWLGDQWPIERRFTYAGLPFPP